MLPTPIKVILRYFRRLLVGLDQFVNVIFGGEVDETISYRAAKLQNKNVLIGCYLCKFLDIFEKNHCDITEMNKDKNVTLLPREK